MGNGCCTLPDERSVDQNQPHINSMKEYRALKDKQTQEALEKEGICTHYHQTDREIFFTL